MKTVYAALLVLLTACAPPPDTGPPPVDKITQALQYPTSGHVQFHIQYSTNYDYSLSHGYWYGSGNPPQPPYNRAGAAIGTAYECPKLWVYVCSTSDPGCASPYAGADGLASNHATVSSTGSWPSPVDGALQPQTVMCDYDLPVTVDGYDYYNVMVGRSCLTLGGYAAGGKSGLAKWTTPRVDPSMSFTWSYTSSGPYLARATWQDIAVSCVAGVAFPAPRTNGPIAKCSQVVGQTCQARVNTSFTW